VAKKVIDVNIFDSKSIDAAITELKRYKASINIKIELLKQRVAEFIRQRAQSGFDNSIADEYTEKTQQRWGVVPKVSSVSVTTQDAGEVVLVVATGDDAIFIEFGAGVHFNGASGYSPHPWGEEHGFLIGEYGQGLGSREQWPIMTGFWSYGTKATMPMYRAVMELKDVFPSMAKEVFG